MSQSLGSNTAKEVGNLHEQGETGPFTQTDQSNNAVGIAIGEGLNIRVQGSEVLSKVLDAGLKGKLTVVTLDENGKERTTKINLSDKKYEKQVQIIQNTIKSMRTQEIKQAIQHGGD